MTVIVLFWLNVLLLSLFASLALTDEGSSFSPRLFRKAATMS